MKIIVLNAATGNKIELNVDPADTVTSAMEKAKSAFGFQGEAKLVTDGTRQLNSMALNDPVNRWFDGQPDDIYRIEDGAGIRYRRVAPITAKKV